MAMAGRILSKSYCNQARSRSPSPAPGRSRRSSSHSPSPCRLPCRSASPLATNPLSSSRSPKKYSSTDGLQLTPGESYERKRQSRRQLYSTSDADPSPLVVPTIYHGQRRASAPDVGRSGKERQWKAGVQHLIPTPTAELDRSEVECT